jgi:hypothetical protein
MVDSIRSPEINNYATDHMTSFARLWLPQKRHGAWLMTGYMSTGQTAVSLLSARVNTNLTPEGDVLHHHAHVPNVAILLYEFSVRCLIPIKINGWSE